MMRLYTNQNLAVGEQITLSAETSHRLQKVMRARPGDPLIVFNGRGGEYGAELSALTKKTATAVINAFIDCDRESPLAISLIQGISRGNRMDYTIQKSVELGVQEIIPVATKRSMVKLDAERKENRHEHWHNVIIHACEQSGRTKIPELRLAMPLEDIATLINIKQSFFLDTQADTPLEQDRPPSGPSYLIAGPEGGLSDEERDWIRQLGASPIKLGPRILRTETAALAALSIMQQRWGDL